MKIFAHVHGYRKNESIRRQDILRARAEVDDRMPKWGFRIPEFETETQVTPPSRALYDRKQSLTAALLKMVGFGQTLTRDAELLLSN